MSAPPVVKAAREAAEAHTDLNTFASVVTILEGGHLYTVASHAAARRIIAICKTEQGKMLRKYDAAMARVLRSPSPQSPQEKT